jgi:hypothetical protein
MRNAPSTERLTFALILYEGVMDRQYEEESRL